MAAAPDLDLQPDLQATEALAWAHPVVQEWFLTRFGSATEPQEEGWPAILAGELHFAIGYTEPEAGTDLASLRTTAVRHGDEYIVNGQKIFTTRAHRFRQDSGRISRRDRPVAAARDCGLAGAYHPGCVRLAAEGALQRRAEEP